MNHRQAATTALGLEQSVWNDLLVLPRITDRTSAAAEVLEVGRRLERKIH
jgi:hypothetical protein